MRISNPKRSAPAWCALLILAAACCAAAPSPRHWIATWGASPAPQLKTEAQRRAAHFEYTDVTLREIVHVTLGGDTLRLRLSNAYGEQPVTLGNVHVALSAGGGAIQPGTDRTVTFGGNASVTLPADAPMLSDPVPLSVPAESDVAISLYVPGPSQAGGIHYGAVQTSYRAAGDQTGAAALDRPATFGSWTYLAGVDVEAGAPASTLVAFGDSITDGAHSTTNANHRWPNFLADRLAGAGGPPIAVVDAGIGGNRLLHDGTRPAFGVDGLARFDRDVIAVPGVRYVIVLEGINDLGHAGTSAPRSEAVTAKDLIGALQQLIARAHEHGLRIYGATLTPFAVAKGGYFTPAKDKERNALNTWIRTSGAFDGVIDFDQATRDPADPDRFLPAYDSGDNLHPNDAGYKAMAGAIDLSLFR